jgi:photosystem II stability/assembly factor-like uncharacterized protein
MFGFMLINSARQIFVLIVCFACFQTANAEWTRLNSGTLAWLRSVYFTNPSKGWIVGSKGTFLSTDDGGKTWKQNKKLPQTTFETFTLRMKKTAGCFASATSTMRAISRFRI